MRATLTRTQESNSSPQGALEHVIEVEGVAVRYLEAGVEHGGLPILMLHGFQGGADLWLPHPLPALAQHFHVIAPDMPGFGDSGLLPTTGTEAYAAAMLAFMDTLGHHSFYLVGHSLGAQIAIIMASMQPERVSRLLVVGGSGLPQSGPRWLDPVKMLSDASAWHFRLYPKVFRLALKARAFRDGSQTTHHDHVTDRLRDVTMPTLVVWGSRDRVAPLEHGAFLAKHLPSARLAIIRGAGHMPYYEKPAQFMKLARAFFSADRARGSGQQVQE
ncbi:MAG: alpha/beta fold hydrolase [Chloroflexota bacterium]|nr:alpha/beta fold hydrolase [Chloroflexota bacterium]